jgi:hypothetical protein
MSRVEDAKIIGKVIAQAWRDEDFRDKLLATPAKVLREAGLELPKGARIKVVRDTRTLKHIVLPVKPSGMDEDEQEEEGGRQCSGGIQCSAQDE